MSDTWIIIYTKADDMGEKWQEAIGRLGNTWLEDLGSGKELWGLFK